ncbi:CGNR zinc finger domain-containing protein [Pseudonocardia yuanmonensis]|uniref:CGNR zinc finger domain-containing protein n=1 Tax=Pseudonocardia yuanmonensis TaxID=1095914 RepID=A0ABP8X875_9PSEU
MVSGAEESRDWPATSRYNLSRAPGELGLVQDFLNTIQEGSAAPPDLLATLTAAREWSDAVRGLWSSLDEACWGSDLPPLTETDRRRLLVLRSRMYHALFPTAPEDGDPAGPGPGDARAQAGVRLTLSHGEVSAEPTGRGWSQFESALLVICYRAQLAGRLRRLKTCKSHECDVVFYDRSPNNSAVWHDVKVCGNRANVRAHRARRPDRPARRERQDS